MQNKKILIAGATGDIGSATAILAASLGAKIVATGRDYSKVSKIIDSLPGEGHVGISSNLESQEDVNQVFMFAQQSMGSIDSVINAIGIQQSTPISLISDEIMDSTLEVNVKISIRLLRAYRSKLVSKNNGNVVLLSSIAGTVGISGESIYSASKGAVQSLSRAAAAELAALGIRVNSVSPGAVEGNMTASIHSRIGDEAFADLINRHPLGLGTVEDIAEAICFLASDKAKWITGINLPVDGGYTAI